jgi:SEC-C motif-containing protein
MRSRYSAFVANNETYLLHSWHPDTRPKRLNLEPRQRWLGLKVLAIEAGTAADDQGTVEFVARYKIDGKGHRLHEISRFVRGEAGWCYVDGVRGATDSKTRA